MTMRRIIDRVLAAILSERAYARLPDHCDVCHGLRGGVRGNENIVDGVVMCDHCSARKLSETMRRAML